MADSEVLSQDEIDALLTGVDSGEIDDVGDYDDDAEGEARTYDFASQDRIVHGRLPTLDVINERAARNLQQSVGRLLRRVPTVSAEGVRVTKYSEYIHTLLVPASFNVVHVRPLKGSALVIFNPNLVFSLVDCFFGGAGTMFNKGETREFTPTEKRIMRNFLDHVLTDLREAWSTAIELDFEHQVSESDPQFINIVTPGEVVVVSVFHVDLDGCSGDIHVVMPYSMIAPIRPLLDSRNQADAAERDERWTRVLQDEVKSATVELRANLTHALLSISQIADLKPGDTFPVTLPDTIVATVGDVPVFRAGYGTSHGRAALKVIEPIHHDEFATSTADIGEHR